MGERLHPASRRRTPNVCDGLAVQRHVKAISTEEAATGSAWGPEQENLPSGDLALLLPSVYKLPDHQDLQVANLHIISQVA